MELERQSNPEIVSPFREEHLAAAFLGVSVRSLQRWRIIGSGPPFHRFGARVLYATTDLLEWASSRRVRSTSEELSRSRLPSGLMARSKSRAIRS